MRGLRSHPVSFGAVLLCMLAASLLSQRMARDGFLNRPITTDENSYVFQAQNFLEGRIARPAPVPGGAFFHPMIIIHPEAGWLSRYSPGHPLWLVPGVALGNPRWMSFLGAALGVGLMSLLGKKAGISPWIPAVLLVISPFYVKMYGTVLSHTSAFLSVTALCIAYMHWQQTGSRRAAVLAGMFWGFLFLNRSYTAFLLAIPFGLDSGLAWIRSREKRVAFPGLAAFAGTAFLFAVFLKVYDKLATGSSRLSPFLFYAPSEGLGFGPRHTRGAVIHHSLKRGLENTWENLLQLDEWLFGMPGGLILVLLLTGIGYRRRWTPLLILSPLTIWAGYVLFWFPGIEHFRPVYYFEALPFLVLGASIGLARLLKRSRVRGRILVSVGLLVLAFFGVRFGLERMRGFAERNRESARLAEVLRGMPKDSLVILAGMGHDETHENMLNPYGLDSQPLVVRGGGLGDAFLPDLFPERTAYILRDRRNYQVEPFPRGQADRLALGLAHFHRRTGDNLQKDGGEWLRVAEEGHAPGLLAFGRYFYLPPGEWTLRVRGHAEEITPEKPVVIELATDSGRAVLKKDTLAEEDGAFEKRFSLQSEVITEVEPRIFYGGSGAVEFSELIFERESR